MKLASVLAAVLLLAGCSSTTEGKSAPKTSLVSTSAAPTTSVSPAGATTAQWASLVAQRSTPVVQAAARIADCPLLDDPNPPDLTCPLGRSTFSTTVQTFGIYFKDAVKPSGLGAPPAEIADLVDRTSQAIDAMASAQAAYDKACVNGGAGPTTDCDPQSLAWADSRDGVTAILNAWKPYI